MKNKNHTNNKLIDNQENGTVYHTHIYHTEDVAMTKHVSGDKCEL